MGERRERRVRCQLPAIAQIRHSQKGASEVLTVDFLVKRPLREETTKISCTTAGVMSNSGTEDGPRPPRTTPRFAAPTGLRGCAYQH